jgi:hypothetical protein
MNSSADAFLSGGLAAAAVAAVLLTLLVGPHLIRSAVVVFADAGARVFAAFATLGIALAGALVLRRYDPLDMWTDPTAVVIVFAGVGIAASLVLSALRRSTPPSDRR